VRSLHSWYLHGARKCQEACDVREICGNQLCSVVLRRAKLQRAPLGKLLNLQVTLSQLMRS